MPCAKQYPSLPTLGEGIFRGQTILNLKVQWVAHLTVGSYRGLWPQAMVSFLEEQPRDFPKKGKIIWFLLVASLGQRLGPVVTSSHNFSIPHVEWVSPQLTYQDICSKRTINQDFIQRDLKDLENSHGSSPLMPVFWGRAHMFLKHLC